MAVPILDDPSYAGRGGGYVARITGKLLYEAATSGQRQLFLPAPDTAAPYCVYAGPDASAPPLYEVAAEFYSAMFGRIERICRTEDGASSGEATAEYDGVAYTFLLKRVSDPGSGVLLSIARAATNRAGT